MRLLRGLAVTVGTLALPVAALFLLDRWSASAATTECEPTPHPADLRNLGVISRLRVAAPTSLVFRFREDRGALDYDTSLALVDDVTALGTSVQPSDGESLAVRSPLLVDTTTSDRIPSDKVHVRALYDEPGHSVDFNVCVDLRDPTGVRAGSYQGSAVLTDARFFETTVPVDVSLKSRGW